MARPTAAQLDLLAVLRDGYRIRARYYLVDPTGRPLAGWVSHATVRVLHRNGWIAWGANGWEITSDGLDVLQRPVV